MRASITVNGQAFLLGEDRDPEKLDAAACQRAGLWVRRRVESFQNELVYHAQNCLVQCRDLDFIVFPSERKYQDAELNWGTSAFLVFADDLLDRVVFRVHKNKNAAVRYAEEFSWACNTRFGDPRSLGRSDHTWIGDGVIVACQIDDSRRMSEFYWMKN